MNIDELADSISKLNLVMGNKNSDELFRHAEELNELIDSARQLKNEIFSEIWSRQTVDEEVITEWERGGKKYSLSHPEYSNADIDQNRRRGPGGKYYPYVEIQVPCRVSVTSGERDSVLSGEGKINLYTEEIIFQDLTIQVPGKNMAMIIFHCQKNSFLID